MKLINKSKLTFSGSHVVSNIDASSSGETAHQGKGTADENFRLSPNFSAGATRAPVQLLPPCWVIVYDPTLIHFGTDILKIVAVLVFFDISYFC